MTTTATTFAIASLAALAACTGNFGGGNTWEAPDAGDGSAAACDNPEIKTMDITVSGSTVSMTAKEMPTGCWNLKGKLTVSGSAASLKDLLGDLRQVDDLVVTNSMVTKIDTVAPIAVTRTLDIENNTVLTSLANIALPNDASCLTYMASLSVTGNQALTDLGGVSGAMCVAGLTDISNNVELTNVTLDSAARLEGGLKVTYNTRMQSLSFTNLSSVGPVTITNNDALVTFNTFNMQNVHGDVMIDSNKLLASLPNPKWIQPATTTSPALTIDGTLTISNNDALTSVGQWNHIGSVLNSHVPLGTYAITVKNNKNLDVCQIREIGCCVAHNDTAQISSGNKGNSCNNGSHSWCYSGGGCPYRYTGD